MIIHELEMIVAQNCPQYNSKLAVNLAPLSKFAENCNSCYNFNKGHCTKELFEGIRDRIRIN